MPDYILHIEIGDEIIKELDKTSYSLLNEHYKEYILGLEGPDLFFYRSFFPGRNKKLSKMLGGSLHKENFSIYSYLILNSLKYFPNSDEKDMLFSYFTGFFAHLFLDLFLHPYIRYKTELYKKKYKTLWLHKRFEMNLDYSYIHKKHAKFSSTPYVKKLKNVKAFPKTISLFFAKILKETYDISFPMCCIISNFNEAYKVMVFVLSFFENSNLIKKYALYPVIYTFLTGKRNVSFLTHPTKEEFKDPLNIEHAPWLHLDLGKEYRFSVLDMRNRYIEFFVPFVKDIYGFIYERMGYPEILRKNYSFSKGVIYEKKGISWIF